MGNYNTLKEEVIDRDLCTGCGTCMGICPTGTIDFQDGKIINSRQKCISCGLCRKVCPGIDFSFPQWTRKIYGKTYDSGNVLGIYHKVFNAYSNDEDIREKGASGGVVTQLLIDLLESKWVQGIVITKAKEDLPYEFETCITTERKQIIEAAQSKYMIIPVNRILSQIKESDGKVAFVGLPCQIQGMRKAMDIDPQLSEKIEFLISIFCGFNMEAGATDFLIAKSHIRKKDINKLEYRRKWGTETGFYIEGNNKEKFFIEKHGYTFLNLIFAPKRCWKCYDYSGEFADIAVGDAWNKGLGWSRIIVRTDKGMSLLNNSMSRETLNLEEANISEIIKTQENVISYKKKQIGVRNRLMKSFPEYGVVFPEQKIAIRIKGFILYLILEMFKTKAGRMLIKVLPFHALIKLSSGLKKSELAK